MPRCQACDPGALCPEAATSAAGDALDPTGTAITPAVCPKGFFCNIQDEHSARYAVQPCPVGTIPDPDATDRNTAA